MFSHKLLWMVTGWMKPLPVFCVILFLVSCRESYTPKPRGYFRLVFPERGYQSFDRSTCPFTFEYPVYGVINRDSVFLDTIPENPCWFNITFPALNGNLHLSYKELNGTSRLHELEADAYRLTFKHTVKADFIEENIIQTENKVSGVWFEVGGNAASALQFYLTDSVRHFVRGSLYFYNTPNADSIAPALDFIKPDLMHLISTWKWDGE